MSSHNNNTKRSDEDTPPPLEDYQYRQFYEAIQDAGAPFDKVYFRRIYSNDRNFYGKVGSKYLKRFQKHVSYLGKLNVEKRTAAIRKFLPSYTEPEDIDEDAEDFDDEGTVDEENEVIKEASVPVQTPPVKKKTTFGSTYTPTVGTNFSTINFTPDTVTFASPPPPSTFSIQPSNLFGTAPTMNAPPPAAAAAPPAIVPRVENFSGIYQDGSREHPTILPFNASRPELHGPFCVEQIEGVRHQGMLHVVYHIRVVTNFFDRNKWNAEVPDSLPNYPSLVGRSIQVKVPAQDHWITNPDRYHGTNNICEATRSVHRITRLAIKNDESRQYQWYLIAFPVGVKLNNHIFSSDSVKIKAKRQGFSEDATMRNGTTHAIRGAVISWIIGLVTPRRVEEDESDDENDDFYG